MTEPQLMIVAAESSIVDLEMQRLEFTRLYEYFDHRHLVADRLKSTQHAAILQGMRDRARFMRAVIDAEIEFRTSRKLQYTLSPCPDRRAEMLRCYGPKESVIDQSSSVQASAGESSLTEGRAAPTLLHAATAG